jgi:hypothetical protein
MAEGSLSLGARSGWWHQFCPMKKKVPKFIYDVYYTYIYSYLLIYLFMLFFYDFLHFPTIDGVVKIIPTCHLVVFFVVLLDIKGRRHCGSSQRTGKFERLETTSHQKGHFLYGSVSKPCTPGEHQNSW